MNDIQNQHAQKLLLSLFKKINCLWFHDQLINTITFPKHIFNSTLYTVLRQQGRPVCSFTLLSQIRHCGAATRPHAFTRPYAWDRAPACSHLRPIKCSLSHLHRKECTLFQRKHNHYNIATFKYLESLFYVGVGRSAPCRKKLDMPTLN